MVDVINEYRYYSRVAIRFFKCADTETLFKLGRVKRFVNCERPALRKLKQLDLALSIEDMRAPPANRLEPLKRDRAGQWSVRVSDQFRLCFKWNDGAEEVEIVDYQGASTMTKKLKPVSPGEMLLEEFLKPLDMSKYRLAKEIGVPAQRIGEIIAGRRGITADTDLRLCRFFGLSDGWWLRLQADYDTQITRSALAKTLAKIKPWAASNVDNEAVA